MLELLPRPPSNPGSQSSYLPSPGVPGVTSVTGVPGVRVIPGVPGVTGWSWRCNRCCWWLEPRPPSKPGSQSSYLPVTGVTIMFKRCDRGYTVTGWRCNRLEPLPPILVPILLPAAPTPLSHSPQSSNVLQILNDMWIRREKIKIYF